jgi:hypothetical protein
VLFHPIAVINLICYTILCTWGVCNEYTRAAAQLSATRSQLRVPAQRKYACRTCYKQRGRHSQLERRGPARAQCTRRIRTDPARAGTAVCAGVLGRPTRTSTAVLCASLLSTALGGRRALRAQTAHGRAQQWCSKQQARQALQAARRAARRHPRRALWQGPRPRCRLRSGERKPLARRAELLGVHSSPHACARAGCTDVAMSASVARLHAYVLNGLIRTLMLRCVCMQTAAPLYEGLTWTKIRFCMQNTRKWV